ncbi:MAG: glycosyltransferase family 4 protein [Patescibacteria group bacterium]|nr:glycosyltransferase family 4 protein [Patescibacteria group bacterium]
MIKSILIVAPYGFNDRMTNFIEFVSGRLLAKNSWKVTAITRSENNKNSIDNICGIKVYRYKNIIYGFINLLYVLIFSRPKIIHIHNLRNNRLGIITAILARVLFIHYIFTEYGLLHDHYLTDDRDDPLNNPIQTQRVIGTVIQLIKNTIKNPRRFKYYISSYIFHWPITHANSIVFVSKHNVPIAKELKLPPNTYLPYIVDDYRWTAINSYGKEVLEKIKNLNGSIVLFIGQMKLRKGWDVLLKAIPYIPKNIIEKFIIKTSTSGNESDEYKDLVESLGIRERIVYLDKFFSNDVLQKIYETSSIVVVPSRYEGFGLVPLEAFEMNKPVIASKVDALTDFLVDEENCIFVPPQNPEELAKAIVKVSNDSQLQKKLIGGGYDTLNRLKSKEYEQKWLEYYNSLISDTCR